MPAPWVRVDHDKLNNIRNVFAAEANAVRGMIRHLMTRHEPLQAGGWLGQGANRYFEEMDCMVFPALQRLQRALEEAAWGTAQISLVFLDAEQEAANLLEPFQQLTVPAQGAAGAAGPEGAGADTAGGAGGTLPAWARGPLGALWSFLRDPFFAAGQLLASVVSEAVSPTGLRGRMFNYLAQHIPQDSVVRKILNSRMFRRTMIGLNVLSGIVEDLNSSTFNGDVSRAIGTNIIDTAIKEVLPTRVTLVNDAIQVGGTFGIMINRALNTLISNDAPIQQMLGRDMDLRANALDRMDLGNATKAYSGALFDGYRDLFRQTGQAFEAAWRDPSSANLFRAASSVGGIASGFGPAGPTSALLMTEGGRQGMFSTLRATGNLLDAAVDTGILTSTSMVRQGAALSSTIVDSLPVSDNFRTAYRDLTRSTIQRHQAMTARAVNLIDVQ